MTMTKISFGPVYTRIQDLVTVQEFADVVQKRGFDSLWVTESIVTPDPGLDCLSTVAAFVGATTRLTLGSCVLLMPFRSPALLAKAVATLDVLSGGRIVLGVGAGGDYNRKAFEVCGVRLEERGARCDEGLGIMTKLWTGLPVNHSGRFYSFRDIVMKPRPIQKPHPPVWVGGEAESVLKRTARWGDGFVPSYVTPADYRCMLDRIADYAKGFGRDISSLTKALHLYVLIDDNCEDAERR
ncbi:MAG: LLM class flavin-dependent oxidoreductase, partial [Dehalococcoidia bacterium]